MNSGSLFLILAIICSASLTIALKIFRSDGDNRFAILLGNYISCIIIGSVMLTDTSSVFRIQPTTLVCGTIAGFLFVAGLVLMQQSIEVNGASLTSAFSRLGLIVPLIISMLFFGERPSWMQLVGLLIALSAMWILKGSDDANNHAATGLLLLVLMAGGFADGMAKIFEQVGSRSQDDLYIFFVFVIAGLLTTFLLLKEYKHSGKTVRMKDFLAGFLVGVPNYFSSSLLLKTLAYIPAFLAYTVFATGTILTVTLISVLLLKEKLGRPQIIGLFMITAALILLNI